jgi:hypothetical protein
MEQKRVVRTVEKAVNPVGGSGSRIQRAGDRRSRSRIVTGVKDAEKPPKTGVS